MVARFVLLALSIGGAALCVPACEEPPKTGRPAHVLLIRHAEKPPDEALSVDLNADGKTRADALADLFRKTDRRPVPFPTPDFIFASRNSKQSHRPLQTVAPLAKALKLTVNDAFANEEYAKLAKELFRKPAYAGKTVLICWHQGTMPDLARSLGAADAPENWKAKVFDRVWRIDYDAEGKAIFSDVPQQLMPDDAAK